MSRRTSIGKWLGVLGGVTGILLGATGTALAHCDTVTGPVVTAAKNALETGNANLVLIWVQPADEAVIRDELNHARAARTAGGTAQQAADQKFFETLVRIHRAGEGAPYTGVKPAGSEVNPAVLAADQALATGTIEPVRTVLTNAVQSGIARQFGAVSELKHYEPTDVAKGRAYVSAYVQYTHFAEGLYDKATASTAHHGPGHDGQLSAHAAGAQDAHAGHSSHSQHLPWVLASVLGLTLIGQTGWIILRRRT
jgi:hypothetical protein